MAGGEADALARGAAGNGGKADDGNVVTGIGERDGCGGCGFVRTRDDRQDWGGGLPDACDVFLKPLPELFPLFRADEIE